MSLRAYITDDWMHGPCRALVPSEHQRIYLINSGHAVEPCVAFCRRARQVHPLAVHPGVTWRALRRRGQTVRRTVGTGRTWLVIVTRAVGAVEACGASVITGCPYTFYNQLWDTVKTCR